MSQRFFLFLTTSVLFLSGCASSTFKARQEQREKMASSAGMYCEFVSSDLFPDLDVELSLQMAKRCDPGKDFSITNYRSSSDQYGVIYCCSTAGRRSSVAPKKTVAPSTQKSDSVQDNDEEVISE